MRHAPTGPLRAPTNVPRVDEIGGTSVPTTRRSTFEPLPHGGACDRERPDGEHGDTAMPAHATPEYERLVQGTTRWFQRFLNSTAASGLSEPPNPSVPAANTLAPFSS